MIYTALYLAAIVAANLLVVRFGALAILFNAFFLIGLDLVCRDRLHDLWRGNALGPKMATLIAAGSLLSWIVNRDAGRVAVASMVAFLAAGLVDTSIYHLLRRWPLIWRINGSNLPSAIVDSLVFPALAFGVFLPGVVAGQIIAKVAGGAFWGLLLIKLGVRDDV